MMNIALRLVAIIIVVLCLFISVFRDRRPSVFFAIENNDTNRVTQCIDSGMRVDQLIVCYRLGKRYSSMLNEAVLFGHPDMVGLLLRKGADPNLIDPQGVTPLMEAVSTGKSGVGDEARMEILRILLAARANPDLKNSVNYGYTPLHEAALLGRSDFVSILLAAGAKVNATNNIGQSAIDLAKNVEVIGLLKAAAANQTVRTNL